MLMPRLIQLFQIIILLDIFKKVTSHMAQLEVAVCYENFSLLSNNNDEPKVFGIVAGKAVHMWCRYCNAKENYYSKLWFYEPRGHFQKPILKEIETNDNGLYITPSHTLNINSFSPNNSGIYTCKSYGYQTGKVFTYILDEVFTVDITPKIGQLRQYQEYKRTYIDSINTKFKLSEKVPYNVLKNIIGISLNVHTVWDNWSECKESHGDNRGIRKRLGRCRISPVVNNTFKHLTKNSSFNIIISYLTDGFDIPCRSVKLNNTIPKISKIIGNIPEFEMEETCPISLEPVKRKKNKEKSVLKTVQQVMENSHVTLNCPVNVYKSDIKWFKDKKLLKSLYGNNVKREDGSHISLDTNNSLHLMRISKNEEGIYACSVSGKKIKQFEVKVVTKSNLLNEEFIRYSIYLGFVLSLTMTCYCAGVCVAWHRRASFADPLNIYKKKPCCHKTEQEKLLG